MPKKVDHQARRRLIADALMRVAAEQGLDAVSLRHVATEAGVSSGMVQHYFRTKDDMLLFALEIVSENVQARLENRPADTAADTPGGEVGRMMRALLIQLLPFDEQRRIEGRVLIAFHVQAAGNPRLAEALRVNNERLQAYLTDHIATAQATGELPDRLDAAHIAATLQALVDGLGLHVLVGFREPEESLAIFDAQLRAVFEAPSAGVPGESHPASRPMST